MCSWDTPIPPKMEKNNRAVKETRWGMWYLLEAGPIKDITSPPCLSNIPGPTQLQGCYMPFKISLILDIWVNKHEKASVILVWSHSSGQLHLYSPSVVQPGHPLSGFLLPSCHLSGAETCFSPSWPESFLTAPFPQQARRPKHTCFVCLLRGSEQCNCSQLSYCLAFSKQAHLFLR